MIAIIYSALMADQNLYIYIYIYDISTQVDIEHENDKLINVHQSW